MRRTLDFLLHDWLTVERMCSRERFREHSRDTFDAVLDLCQRLADEKFAPFNRAADLQEPQQVGDEVVLPDCAHEAARAYVEAGLSGAIYDYAQGGMQLPHTIDLAANAMFAKAAIGFCGHLLTAGNANLILAHGSEAQRRAFAMNEIAGRWSGTMCLSEPQAGSSLADILSRAVPDGDDHEADPLGPRYRLFGTKMWITNGEHPLSENIVHLVLAKVPGADGRPVAGTRGISLFIVPKWLARTDGSRTDDRNDVVLAGLNHKMGYRGLPNTLLNFGEGRYPVDGRPGAVAYRVGRAGEGLRYMFHMMNEARIAVGAGATALGCAGYEASLEYARTRRQGRRLGAAGRDPSAPPVPIIEHADVKRMLLAQKAYAEGALALTLYCGTLVDELKTGDPARSGEIELLLELLTPIAKSWPSEWCLEGNNLAIQVLGGCGYTRDFPVEQFWRDNRLNMIHEGAHGIHGIDLLGRKVVMREGAALKILDREIRATSERAEALPGLESLALACRAAWNDVFEATHAAWQVDDIEAVLANATPYLQAFGHAVLAWLWLDVAATAQRALARDEHSERAEFLRGKLQAARYFHAYELPKIAAWLAVVTTRDATCRNMRDEWFAT